MLIRIASTLLVFSLLLGVIGYFYVRAFPPFDQQKIAQLIVEKEIGPEDYSRLTTELESAIDKGLIFDYLSVNAYVGSALFLLAICFAFVSLHSVVDKLFFKKFFEAPNYIAAARRGFFLIIAIAGLIYARLLGFNDLELLLIPLFIISVEVAISITKPNLFARNKEAG